LDTKPNPDRRQLYHRKVIVGELLESHGDTAKMLDPIEEALDVIALFVKRFGETVALLAVDFVAEQNAAIW
jgi:hypothetical protein